MSDFSAHFGLLEKELGADGLQELRRNAMDRFLELGLPTTKQEEWRYTNVAPVFRNAFDLARPGANGVSAADVTRLGLGSGLVFVDGHYRADLSQPPVGVTVLGLGDERVRQHLGRYASYESEAFVALNTAFLEDGAFLAFDGILQDPVHILFVGTGKACHPRSLYLAGDGAQATIVETWVTANDNPHLTNSVTEVVVGANASVEHYRLQCEGETAHHFAHLVAHQEKDSRFTSNAVTLGGALTRNDITAALDAEGIVCTLNGLFLAHGSQHVDNHTRIEHRKPNCESHELYKGILDDRSTGVFSGYIHVFEDAQKTDAYQSSKNLLLSDDAVVNSKPQLEIYADDVKCSHGSTTGQMDKDALFYLRSRGIPEEASRNMLIRAFANDVTDRIAVAAVRERIERLIEERLPA